MFVIREIWRRLWHSITLVNKNSSQIVRINTADVLANFFRRQTLMRIHWIFWCICKNTITSQRLSIQSVAPYATIRPQFKGVVRSPILGFKGVLVGWDSHQSKADPRLPNCCQYKVLLYLPPCLATIPVSSCDPPLQFDPRPIWRVTVDLRGLKSPLKTNATEGCLSYHTERIKRTNTCGSRSVS